MLDTDARTSGNGLSSSSMASKSNSILQSAEEPVSVNSIGSSGFTEVAAVAVVAELDKDIDVVHADDVEGTDISNAVASVD